MKHQVGRCPRVSTGLSGKDPANEPAGRDAAPTTLPATPAAVTALARPGPDAVPFHPMITGRSYAIRPVETDADLERWRQVRRLVHPDDPPPTLELLKAEAGPDRLLVLVESGG